MGYTTEFEGQFRCYRAESKEVGIFLQTILEGNLSGLGPLADWLLERGDPRGETIAALLKKPPRKLDTFWRLFGLKREHAVYLRAFSAMRRVKRDAKKVAVLPDPLREAVGLPV